MNNSERGSQHEPRIVVNGVVKISFPKVAPPQAKRIELQSEPVTA